MSLKNLNIFILMFDILVLLDEYFVLFIFVSLYLLPPPPKKSLGGTFFFSIKLISFLSILNINLHSFLTNCNTEYI